MRKLKEFPEERKVEVLEQVLAADDIREVLTKGLHRRHILSISNWGLSERRLTEDQFKAIIGKIERPREFPTDPEQRLEALLSVGNTEPKQVLGMLLSDNPQSVESLRTQFIRLIEGVRYKGRQWKPEALTIEDYLTLSLDSIGFIAFPVIDTRKIGYARTAAGRYYGQPVMAFMLHTSKQLGISMYQLLGSTATRGDSRAPYNRFRILEFLLSQRKNDKETRVADISYLLNLNNPGVSEHLNILQEIGIIEFSSISPEIKGQIIYRWKKGENTNTVPIFFRQKTLTQEVAEYLCRNREGNNIEVVEHLKTKVHYKQWRYKSLLCNVNNILSHLEKHGFAEADYKGGAIHSRVTLVRGWADFVEEFTEKLRDASNDGAELKAMEQLYGSYISDYDRFRNDSRTAVGLYVPVSPKLNQLTPEDAKRKILKYLLGKGESRPRDMKKDLGFGVKNHLYNMTATGTIVLRREGRKSLYSINPNYRPN